MRTVFQEVSYHQIGPAIQYLRAKRPMIEEMLCMEAPVRLTESPPSLPNNEADVQFGGLLHLLENWNDFSRSIGRVGPHLQNCVLPSEDANRMYGTLSVSFREAFPDLFHLDRHEAVKKLKLLIGKVKTGMKEADHLTAEIKEELLKSMDLLYSFLHKAANNFEYFDPATA